MSSNDMSMSDIHNMNKAAWALARQCLDVLPPEDIGLSGLALMHIIVTWLAEVPEKKRPSTYVQWMDMLHKQLVAAEVLLIRSEIEQVPITEASEAVH